MSVSTRRTFLAMVGAGAAVAGAAAVASPGVAGFPARSTPSTTGVAERLPADAAGSMVAYVHDVRTGEVAVMVEGREVIVTDRELVAAMHRALAGASRAS